MRTRLHALAATAAVLLLSAGVARADDEADRGQARDLGTKATEAASAGDWAKAEDLFRRADTLYHAPTLLLGLARARAHLGKYVEAWEDYHRIIIEPLPPSAGPALKKAVDDAKAEIGSVEGKRAHATISVTGAASPTVTLDGVALSAAGLGTERAVNPGSHAVHVEAPGCKPADATFTVAEGASASTSIAMQPADVSAAPASVAPVPAGGQPVASGASTPDSGDDPGATRRLVGIVGMGLGGAGLVTGVITGFVAMGQHSSLASNSCATGACGQSDLSSYQSSVSSYKTVGMVSTVSLIAGGVLAAGGAVLFFTAPRREAGAPAPSALWITPYVGPMSAGAAGTF